MISIDERVEEPLIATLQRALIINQRPLSIYIGNTGGTITCLPNSKGLMEPIESDSQLEELIMGTMGLGFYVQRGLLEVKLDFIFRIDSSQMRNPHRQTLTNSALAHYHDVDGGLLLHGTDSGADSAKFMAVAAPYYDPVRLWLGRAHGIQFRNGNRPLNCTKPYGIASAQVAIPSAYTKTRMDSDGPMNLYVGLLAIAEGRIMETGWLTNNTTILSGPASIKVRETAIPPYQSDPAVKEMASYTAEGLHYNEGTFLQQGYNGRRDLVTVTDAASQNGKVIVVHETHHLAPVQYMLEAEAVGSREIAAFIKERMPAVIIYVSKGAGNVVDEDYALLKAAEDYGLVSFRVPIPGGRIPARQVYDVPGHDIPALNMQPATAEYKALMCLSLADRLGIPPQEKPEFLKYMMTEQWGNEFLPQR